jgi:hypothetical protein
MGAAVLFVGLLKSNSDFVAVEAAAFGNHSAAASMKRVSAVWCGC